MVTVVALDGVLLYKVGLRGGRGVSCGGSGGGGGGHFDDREEELKAAMAWLISLDWPSVACGGITEGSDICVSVTTGVS